MKKITLLTGLCLIIQSALWSQTTGSFDTTITFMSESRTLACHVPATYNPSKKYQVLIGLHGLGDNGANYRNVLISNANWESVFPETIFIFPDGGSDQNKDFYAPIGDELIIEECINFLDNNYSIDQDSILLQGFSLGGRSALKYGLENPSKFKGLILNTPALQGIRDANNDSIASLVYNYSNASQVPIYVIVGGDDFAYSYTLNQLYHYLKTNDGVFNNQVIAGMGHTIPSNQTTTEALTFINQNSNKDYDVELFEITNAQRICDNELTPKCLIRNMGDEIISSVEFTYSVGGNSNTYTWNGTLAAFEHQEISLPLTNVANGTHNLTISAGTINGSQIDPDLTNNSIVSSLEAGEAIISIPYVEDFDGSYDDWLFEQNFNLFEWYEESTVSYSGSNSIASINIPLFFFFYTMNQVESFTTPVIDFSTSVTSKLSFKLAYNYIKYEPPVVQAPFAFADTLEVLISTDCGSTYQSVFKKGGADLATAANPILNPLQTQSSIYEPTQDEWNDVEIDLSAYSDNQEVIVKFSCISGNGGSMYIDDISFGGTYANINDEIKSSISIYPNPASDQIMILGESNEDYSVRITDLQGKVVYNETKFNTNNSIDISHLTDGYYLVETISNGQKTIEKLVVSK